MNRKIAVVMLLMFVMIVVSGCLGSAELQVKATINKFYNYMKNKNITGISEQISNSYYDQDGIGKQELLSLFAFAFLFVDYNSIEVTFSSVVVTGTQAIVSTSSRIKSTFLGETTESTQNTEFKLQRESGKWLITSFRELE